MLTDDNESLTSLTAQWVEASIGLNREALALRIIKRLSELRRIEEGYLWAQSLISNTSKFEAVHILGEPPIRDEWRLSQTGILPPVPDLESDLDGLGIYALFIHQSLQDNLTLGAERDIRDAPGYFVTGYVENFAQNPEFTPEVIQYMSIAMIDFMELRHKAAKQGNSYAEQNELLFQKALAKDEKESNREEKRVARAQKIEALQARADELKINRERDLAQGIPHKVASTLREGNGHSLYDDYVFHLDCRQKPDDSKVESIIFTTTCMHLASRWIEYSEVESLSVGSQIHTQHHGSSSTTSEYLVLEFRLKDFTAYRRLAYLGKNEGEINARYPTIVNHFHKISSNFTITEAGSFQSSGGYVSSYGFGVFF